MFPRVTVILVVHRGGEPLRRTMAAIRAQRRAPDAVTVVLTAADAATREQVADIDPDHVIGVDHRLTFGEAIRVADGILSQPDSETDALWLLPEDATPDADALAELFATLETSRSVAIVAPKLMRADAPERIAHLGRSVDRLGRTIALVDDELDQGQYDGLSDVLGVDPAGMLVRHRIWRELDGFDRALPTADDALDFSVRARLAGNRVALVPAARITFEGSGIAGPEDGRSGRIRRRRAFAERAARLHRRLVWAPTFAVPLHWLSLLPLALLRSIAALLLKSPGSIPGEIGAALRAMFAPGVLHARRAIRRTRTTRWSSIDPLRVPPETIRRRRRVEADVRRARARRRVDEIDFLATGGGWVLLSTAVISVIMLLWLVTAGGLQGGALLPLSNSVADLWHNAADGWRDIGPGFVGGADPFAGLLAVLGTITFWAPSFALVLVWLLAVPAAALGAWFTAARLTQRGSLRAVAALLWAFSPPLLIALADGRPGAVIAHVLLGWLAFAVIGAATSWASAAAAGLLFAAVVAGAPSLAPALLVAWLVALLVSGRAAIRLAGIPIPALVLALPLMIDQFARSTPLALLADPGVATLSAVPSTAWLALGFPGGGVGHWDSALAWVGASVDLSAIEPVWIVAGLLAPLALAALAALATKRLRAAALWLGAALLGFATAVGASLVSFTNLGAEPVALWTGAGQSLMFFGLVFAATMLFDTLRRNGVVLASAIAVLGLVAVMPSIVALTSAHTAVAASADRTLPAFVTAEAHTDPRVTTLRMRPTADGSLRATLERGAGVTLDEQSTLDQTATSLSADEQRLAEIAGNLASRSSFDADAATEEFGVAFVLLDDTHMADTQLGEATEQRARAALDGNAALVPVGETDFGTLWRFADAQPNEPGAALPSDAGQPRAQIVTIVQLIVLAGLLLLMIPTGPGREIDRRPKRVRRSAKRRSRRAARAEAAEKAAAVAVAQDELVEARDAAAAADADVERDANNAIEPEPEPEPEPEADADRDAGEEPR